MADPTPEEKLPVLVAALRGGAHPEVAAARAGLDRSTLRAWLRRAEQGEAPFTALLTAVGQARAAVEQAAYAHDPLRWLLSGPGRERPGAPGWASPARPLRDPLTQFDEGELSCLLEQAIADLPADEQPARSPSDQAP